MSLQAPKHGSGQDNLLQCPIAVPAEVCLQTHCHSRFCVSRCIVPHISQNEWKMIRHRSCLSSLASKLPAARIGQAHAGPGHPRVLPEANLVKDPKDAGMPLDLLHNNANIILRKVPLRICSKDMNCCSAGTTVKQLEYQSTEYYPINALKAGIQLWSLNNAPGISP